MKIIMYELLNKLFNVIVLNDKINSLKSNIN